MAKIYRFELMFMGELQQVGFLQGLDDIGLSNAEVRGLLSMFDSLPVEELDESVSFWFTKEGIRTFETAINRVNAEISNHGWSLAGAFMEAPGGENALFEEDEIIYQDQYQIALCREGIYDLVACGDIEYVEIYDVETFLMATENGVMLQFQKEINELPFDPPPSVLRDLGGRIEEAHSEKKGLCGLEVDGLMYQLWQRNPEVVEGMGYEYSDD